MHELSIALGIMEGVLEELGRRGVPKASAVHVRVGRLSGVDKDALSFSYGVATQETPLAHSRLIIEDVDVSIHCPVCGAERPIRTFPVLACAQCGSTSERIIHGRELEITAVEVTP